MSRIRPFSALAFLVALLLDGSHSREAFSQAGSSEITILSSGYDIGELAPCG